MADQETTTQAPKKYTIDGKEYSADQISDSAKAHIMSIRYVDEEFQRLQNQLQVLKAARRHYVSVVQKELGE